MKKIYNLIVVGCFAALLLTTHDARAKSKKNAANKKVMVLNAYQDDPQLFQAEYGVIGKYWCKEKNRPAKAFISDDEFINIVVIKTKQLQTKHSKKLRKHKDYLGTYLSPKTNLEYNLYGVNKNPKPFDDGPDSDVRTVIAIKQDFGIGE